MAQETMSHWQLVFTEAFRYFSSPTVYNDIFGISAIVDDYTLVQLVPELPRVFQSEFMGAEVEKKEDNPRLALTTIVVFHGFIRMDPTVLQEKYDVSAKLLQQIARALYQSTKRHMGSLQPGNPGGGQDVDFLDNLKAAVLLIQASFKYYPKENMDMNTALGHAFESLCARMRPKKGEEVVWTAESWEECRDLFCAMRIVDLQNGPYRRKTTCTSRLSTLPSISLPWKRRDKNLLVVNAQLAEPRHTLFDHIQVRQTGELSELVRQQYLQECKEVLETMFIGRVESCKLMPESWMPSLFAENALNHVAWPQLVKMFAKPVTALQNIAEESAFEG